MKKLEETLVKASKNEVIPTSDKDTINAILTFLMYRTRFYQILTDKRSNELPELKDLGNALNELQANIINYIREDKAGELNTVLKTNNINELIHVYAIKLLPYTLSANEDMVLALYKSTNSYDFLEKSGDIIKVFGIMQQVYEMWEDIYSNNGEYGLIRYISLDKKIRKNMKTSIPGMYIGEELSLDDIIGMTSLESKLNSLNDVDRIKAIKGKEKFVKKNNTIINL